ncbi:MAG: ribosome silencing factor [Muribaculaceae bacterium]|nr:ribosome silencing factor [Muribaculaceae bacterium]
MSTTPDLTRLIVEGIQNRKGRGITIIDMSSIDTAATRRFVIAEGTSTTQTVAIAESVEESVREGLGLKPFGSVGANTGEWVVLDFGDTWVHIFLPPVRQHYNLEELWSDATITEIPDLD